MSELAHQTGPNGEQYLIESADGRTLVEGEGCAACCNTVCLYYWLCLPCDTDQGTAEGDPCYDPTHPTPNPGVIYIPTTFECGGSPVEAGQVIVVDGFCYEVTAERFRDPARTHEQCPESDPLPPGARIVQQFDCVGPRGCREAVCLQGRTPYGIAQQCDPSVPEGRTVYYCRRLVTGCIYMAVSPALPQDGPVPARCFKFATDNPGGFPGPGSVVLTSLGDPSGHFTSCCSCTAALVPTKCFHCIQYTETTTTGPDGIPQTVHVEGPPCCLDKRRPCLGIEISAKETVISPGVFEEFRVDPVTVSCTGGSVTMVHTVRFSGQPEFVENLTRIIQPVAEGGACPPDPTLALGLGFPGQVDSSVLKVTCDTFSLRGRSGGFSLEVSAKIIRGGSNAAPCAGNCGAGSDAIQKSGPVPYQEWPGWAKAIGAMKKPEDKGVGETVERIINATGPLAVAAKAALKLVMKDCGCAGRKRDWTAQFPY